jgi:hypothetical protein
MSNQLEMPVHSITNKSLASKLVNSNDDSHGPKPLNLETLHPQADAMGLLESIDHLTVAEGCGINISLGGAGDAASALQRVVEDPSRTVKGAKEIAAEAVVRVQGPPHSMQVCVFPCLATAGRW